MTRPIDYGQYLDQTSFEHQLTKELEQLNDWACSVTDMDSSEAFEAIQDALKGFQA